MPKANPTIPEWLSAAHVAITNIRASAELQAALSRYGYTPERIEQGTLLREAVKAQYQQQIAAYGGLRSAADALASSEKEMQAIYTRHMQIARLALAEDRGALQTLALSGRRKDSLAGWIAQAQQFYSAALADGALQSRLAAFSLSRDMLAAGAQQLEAVTACHATRSQQRGTAQNATCVRDAALSELVTWMRELKITARLALKDRPQLLEQIGMTV